MIYDLQQYKNDETTDKNNDKCDNVNALKVFVSANEHRHLLINNDYAI